MKQTFKKLSYLLPLIFVAGIVGATYSDPSAAAPNANTTGPITIGVTDQVKPGPLTVGTFQARGNAWLQQSSFASGLVRGGLPADVTSTLTFGDSTHATNLDFSKDVSVTGTIQSASLAGAGESRVCADVNGKFYRCDLSVVSTIHLALMYSPDDTDNDAACAYVKVKNLATNLEYYVDALQGISGGFNCTPVSTLGYVDAPSGNYTVTRADIYGVQSGLSCNLTYWQNNVGVTPFGLGTNFQLSGNFYITGSCS